MSTKYKFTCGRCDFSFMRLPSDRGKPCPKCFYDKTPEPAAGASPKKASPKKAAGAGPKKAASPKKPAGEAKVVAAPVAAAPAADGAAAPAAAPVAAAPAAAPAAGAPAAAAPKKKAAGAKKPAGAAGSKKVVFKCARCEFKLARLPADLGKICPKCFYEKPYSPDTVVKKA